VFYRILLMSFCVSVKLKKLFFFPIIIVSAMYFRDFYSLIKKFIYLYFNYLLNNICNHNYCSRFLIILNFSFTD